MEKELEAQQRLLLWLLAVQPKGGMFRNETGLSFKTAGHRKALATFGYTQETKEINPDSGRKALFVSLTDKGWEWCQDHMSEAIDSRSPRVKDVLSGVLKILSRYFQNQSHCSSLGDLVLQARADELQTAEIGTQNQEDTAPTAISTLRSAISQACLDLTGGQSNVRVRIADLRSRLPEYTRDEIDQELLAMERCGALSSFQLDDPEEITSADEAAVLVTPAGSNRHIVYFEGSQL